MISEHELWACAHQLLKQHGARAPAFVAERIGSLSLLGDEAGVATWRAIALRMDSLERPQDAVQ